MVKRHKRIKGGVKGKGCVNKPQATTLTKAVNAYPANKIGG